MRMKRVLKDERGSLSIEFLGILPFYFLFFLLLWQVVASGYAVLSLKAAANDGAQVYSVTGDYYETLEAVNKSIGGGSLIQNHTVTVNLVPGSSDLFEVKINASHPLVFLPDSWKKSTMISLESTATGKELVP